MDYPSTDSAVDVLKFIRTTLDISGALQIPSSIFEQALEQTLTSMPGYYLNYFCTISPCTEMVYF